MSNLKLTIFALCSLVLATHSLPGQGSDSKPKLNILNGPAKAQLEKIAQIDVPEGYIFIDGKSTRALMKASGEPVSGSELGLLKATKCPLVAGKTLSGIGFMKPNTCSIRARILDLRRLLSFCSSGKG